MPTTVAAGLLALVGLFDVAGTIASGGHIDRVDRRYLLLAYYVPRGFAGPPPLLFGPGVAPSMLAFIIFYGLDWVATIPPTMARCREAFGAAAPVVFGWTFARSRSAPAVMALTAGAVRDESRRLPTWPGTSAAGCAAAGGLSRPVKRAPGRALAIREPVGWLAKRSNGVRPMGHRSNPGRRQKGGVRGASGADGGPALHVLGGCRVPGPSARGRADQPAPASAPGCAPTSRRSARR